MTDWVRALRAKVAVGGLRPRGLHVVMDPDWGERLANVGRNLEQGRIARIQALVRKA